MKESAACIAILLLFALFLAHKQDISLADIGRHIRNGEFLFKDPQVLYTNFYSYTDPGFAVLNHHWGAGLLFYLIWRVTGFAGLHLCYAALSLLSFGIFFRIALKQSGLVAAGLSALVVIPLLAQRTEIRPEGLTYVLAALFLWLLVEWREKRIDIRKLYLLLPVLELLWVNLHIYFIFGLFIVGVFWLDSIFYQRETARKMFLLLLLTTCATLVNPFGVKGALAPFTIFQNYGITVAENDPVWVIDRYFGFFSYDTLNLKIVSALLAASFLASFKRVREIPLPYLLFAGVFSVLAWCALRNMVLFGLFSVPVMATNISLAFDRAREGWERYFLPAVFLVLAAGFVLFSNGMLSDIFRLYPEKGFGLAKGNSSAAEFIKKNQLQGPIFNDYNSGGYLIYYLFPEERVFVDNRPEAYQSGFLKQVYSKMQISEAKWNEVDAIVGFNTVVVRKSMDISVFANTRLHDPRWRCVFDDPFFLIFIKRPPLSLP
jgi:hypothetical protein